MKRKLTAGLSVILLYTAILFLINFGGYLSQGIKNGIDISLNLIIPSMFLFLALSEFIFKANLSKAFSFPFSFLKRPLKLSEQELTIFLLSVIGGYPIGARLLSSAVKEKRTSPENASRLLCFCTNCGPAFLINAVGIGIYKSIKIGIYIYISQLAAALVIAVFCRKSCGTDKAVGRKAPLSIAFVQSVSGSVKALGVICSFILFFSAFMPIINLSLSSFTPTFRAIISAFLEITSGCCSLATLDIKSAVVLTAVFTSFGGVCVLLQLNAIISGSGISLKKLLVGRIPYCIISGGITYLLLSLDPSAAQAVVKSASAIIQKSYGFSSPPIACVFMLILSIMLLFSVKKFDIID